MQSTLAVAEISESIVAIFGQRSELFFEFLTALSLTEHFPLPDLEERGAMLLALVGQKLLEIVLAGAFFVPLALAAEDLHPFDEGHRIGSG